MQFLEEEKKLVKKIDYYTFLRGLSLRELVQERLEKEYMHAGGKIVRHLSLTKIREIISKYKIVELLRSPDISENIKAYIRGLIRKVINHQIGILNLKIAQYDPERRRAERAKRREEQNKTRTEKKKTPAQVKPKKEAEDNNEREDKFIYPTVWMLKIAGLKAFQALFDKDKEVFAQLQTEANNYIYDKLMPLVENRHIRHKETIITAPRKRNKRNASLDKPISLEDRLQGFQNCFPEDFTSIKNTEKSLYTTDIYHQMLLDMLEAEQPQSLIEHIKQGNTLAEIIDNKNKNTPIREVYSHLISLLEKMPYIDDMYANLLLYGKSNHSNQTEYGTKITQDRLSRHLKELVTYLCEEHIVRTYVDSYISIADEDLKKGLLDQIKSYLSLKLFEKKDAMFDI